MNHNLELPNYLMINEIIQFSPHDIRHKRNMSSKGAFVSLMAVILQYIFFSENNENVSESEKVGHILFRNT